MNNIIIIGELVRLEIRNVNMSWGAHGLAMIACATGLHAIWQNHEMRATAQSCAPWLKVSKIVRRSSVVALHDIMNVSSQRKSKQTQALHVPVTTEEDTYEGAHDPMKVCDVLSAIGRRVTPDWCHELRRWKVVIYRNLINASLSCLHGISFPLPWRLRASRVSLLNCGASCKPIYTQLYIIKDQHWNFTSWTAVAYTGT